MVLDANDREVIEACQRGDFDAFGRLFEAYKDRVYSIALRFSGDHGTAMDIAQETFLKLFSRIKDFRGEASFFRTPAASALQDMLRTEMQNHVQQVIGNLPPDLRIVVVLRYTEGLPYEEIAEILGCPLGTVASRLNRAHKLLERRLSTYRDTRI